MKLRPSLVTAAALALLLQLSSSPADADSQPLADAWTMFNAVEQPNSIGVLFDENVSNGVSIGWQNGANEKRIFGECKNVDSGGYPLDVGCVIGLSSIDSEGNKVELTALGEINGSAGVIPEDVSSDLPASRSPILYQDSNHNLYLLRAGDWISHNGGTSEQTLSVDLAEVIKVPDASMTTPIVTGSGSNLVVIPSPAECYGVSQGFCYKTVKLQAKQAFELRLKAPESIKGWFRTRLSNAQATVTTNGSAGEIIDIQGAAMNVPVVGGWIPYATLSKSKFSSLESFFSIPSPDSQGSFQFLDDRVDRSDGFEDYLNLFPYLPTKALLTRYEWGFDLNALDNSFSNSCLTSTSGISGIVSTNGGIFNGGPPEWNAATHTLDYQVAAPHSDEQGNDLEGEYQLQVPNSVIQCLYGTSAFPASATISIAGQDSSSYVATAVLGSSDGWSTFQISGFHYSNPNIEVTFSSPNSTPTPVPVSSALPNVMPIPQPKSVATSPAKKKMNYCTKGKLTNALKAGVTKCPKGWTLVQR